MKGQNLWHKKQRQWIATLMALSVGLVFAYPLVWMFISSFKPENEIFGSFNLFGQHHLSWANYKRIFADPFYFRWMINSVIVVISSIVFKLSISSLAGYAFARMRFRGRNSIFFVLVLTMMVPWQVILLPQYWIFQQLHLINTLYAVILPNIFDAFAIFMMRQFFIKIPLEISEAAVLDGCGSFMTFYRIILPLATPALTALGILNFFWIWDQYIQPLIFLNSTKVLTLPVGVALLQAEHGTSYGMQMAAASLAVLPVLVVFIILQRKFVEGVALTGVKG